MEQYGEKTETKYTYECKEMRATEVICDIVIYEIFYLHEYLYGWLLLILLCLWINRNKNVRYFLLFSHFCHIFCFKCMHFLCMHDKNYSEQRDKYEILFCLCISRLRFNSQARINMSLWQKKLYDRDHKELRRDWPIVSWIHKKPKRLESTANH